MAVTEQTLMDALKGVIDPNTGRDFVSSKSIKNLTVTDGDVAFDVELGYPAKSQIPGFRKDLIAAAKGVAGVDNVSVNVTTKITAHAVQRGVAACCPRSKTSWPWPPARVAWARAPPPSIWRWHWRPKAPVSACWMPTFTAPAFP